MAQSESLLGEMAESTGSGLVGLHVKSMFPGEGVLSDGEVEGGRSPKQGATGPASGCLEQGAFGV